MPRKEPETRTKVKTWHVTTTWHSIERLTAGLSTGAKEKGITVGIAVGAVIALEALFAGPITGASMNPARSLAPALVSAQLSNLWIYLLAPVLGALIAVAACRCVREEGCCPISAKSTLSNSTRT